MTFVLGLDAIGRQDLPRVGGKAANLGALMASGLPVPPGFCVTTDAFRCFVAGEDLEPLLEDLGSVPMGDLKAARHAGERLRAALEQRAIPAELQEAILAAWRAAGSGGAYAVRSSATAEDLPDASFAGQQDSYLNVIGAQALLDDIRRCWASLYTDRAILYRLEHGIRHREVALAVVVQRMVVPEKSGILFTADPLTGHREITSINAGFGLGEALVSGLVSADLYRVDRRDDRIIEARRGDKRIAVVPLPGGGTRREELDATRRGAPVLTEDEVLELSRIGARIQGLQGCPQDVEWCIEQGAIFVVQARPITSLYPVPKRRAGNGGSAIFFCFNHLQVMTDAMPPLACAVWRRLLPLGKDPDRMDEPVPAPWVSQAGGRLFIDLSPVLRLPVIGSLVIRGLQGVDQLAATAIRQVASRPELQRGPRVSLRAMLRFLLPGFASLQWTLWLRNTAEIGRQRTVWIQELIEGIQVAIEGEPDTARRLIRARNELVALFPRVLELPPIVLAGIAASALLRRVALAAPGEMEALGRALPNSVTTTMDLEVADLADLARVQPDLRAALRAGVVDRETLAKRAGASAFTTALDRFLDRYGARTPGEIDLSRRRWREDPSSVLRVVAGNLAQRESGAHRTRHQRLIREAEAAGQRLIERSGEGLLGRLRAPLVRRLVRVLRDLAGLREHGKWALIEALDLLRQQVLAAGADLAASGRIEDAEDVWFLEVEELASALRSTADPPDLRLRITRRRTAHLHHQRLYPPRVITSEGEIPVARHRGGFPAGALAGSPASAGVVEGIARVIADPAAEVLPRGEILVAAFTDPGWTPLFINAAGLVMEVGGLMTHGSVVAREYGIPAVVCVPDATQLIRTGDRLRVDGDRGYVLILQEGRG